MKIFKDYSLKEFNTFGLDVKSSHFVELLHEDDFQTFLSLTKPDHKPYFIIGEGSNVLFVQDFQGTVIKINIKGIEIIKQEGNFVYVKAYGGEIWDDLVKFSVENGYGGIENLSMIPGCVGAAPIQNIGAYGVELKDMFVELEAIALETGERRTFTHKECNFGYRSSIFKKELKNQYLIVSVTLRLSRTPVFNTSYGSIEKELAEMAINDPCLKAIREAVINIRSRKLPGPDVLGNAGSFFKNPLISNAMYENLKERFREIISYKQSDGRHKLSAGWMIEFCGWKGFRRGDVGVYDQQALVLVNYGHATGKEIMEIAKEISESVFNTFGITLEMEVNVV